MQDFRQYDFQNKVAIVRVDFNVPLHKETAIVTDDKRIRAAIPTIQHILKQGGSVRLLSHFGRPKNGPEARFSLRQVLPCLENLLGMPVMFCDSFAVETTSEMQETVQPGSVVLYENVRFNSEESKGGLGFAETLSKLGDCYVNDAFGAAHRAHASTTQLASFFPNDKMMGFLMEAEVQNAKKILDNPLNPFVAIIGGAKVSDKILIIENLLNIASDIIIGGGMAYTFAKALGGDIGNSLYEPERIEKVNEILALAKSKKVNIHIPVDSVLAHSFSETAEVMFADTQSIPSGWMGLDIGPKAITEFEQIIKKSKTILWNGPMGVFEWSSFENGTKQVAMAVCEATRNGSYSLIGGGDSAAAIAKFGLENDVSFVSTGGGALLEYFEGKSLPGIMALEN